ncbi:hypothetical protein BGZ65_008575, partial [Modicella reniformis]
MATHRHPAGSSPAAAGHFLALHHVQNQTQNLILTQSQIQHQNRNHVPSQLTVVPTTHPHPSEQRKMYPYPPHEQDTASNGHPTTSSEPPSPFFMKPLTRAPDYRFNLYVKGLVPTTTTRGLFEIFKPYGNILACKTILDIETGYCRGGFVLFDNQESCTEARRALTQQGLYLDDSDQFPSLPSKPLKKQQQSKVMTEAISAKVLSKASLKTSSKALSKASPEASSNGSLNGSSSESPPPISTGSSIQLEVASHQSNLGEPGTTHNTIQAEAPKPPAADLPAMKEPYEQNGASSKFSQDIGNMYTLGQSYLDFDSGFIGAHQQFLSEGYHNPSGFERGPSFLGHKPYMGVEDIDRYMNMLEMNAVSMAPQISANMPEGRQFMHPNVEHSNARIDGRHTLRSVCRPSIRALECSTVMHDSEIAQANTDLCIRYGSLILTSVDIRYINEDCFGQGRVTFESHKDSEVALVSLLAKNFTVRLGDSGDMYPSEPVIDDHLYDQYYQQHQDLLRLGDSAPFGSPDEVLACAYNQDFLATTSALQPFPSLHNEFVEQENLWNMPIPDKMSHLDRNPHHGHVAPLDVDMESHVYRHEKLSMLGISPQPISFSPASSSSSSLQQFQESTESPSIATKPTLYEQPIEPELTTNQAPLSENEETTSVSAQHESSKLLSYSDIVKAPVKSVVHPSHSKDNIPHQDLKRRGNTNKSLDEKEYRLNLFLKNLEPTMD